MSCEEQIAFHGHDCQHNPTKPTKRKHETLLFENFARLHNPWFFMLLQTPRCKPAPNRLHIFKKSTCLSRGYSWEAGAMRQQLCPAGCKKLCSWQPPLSRPWARYILHINIPFMQFTQKKCYSWTQKGRHIMCCTSMCSFWMLHQLNTLCGTSCASTWKVDFAAGEFFFWLAIDSYSWLLRAVGQQLAISFHITQTCCQQSCAARQSQIALMWEIVMDMQSARVTRKTNNTTVRWRDPRWILMDIKCDVLRSSGLGGLGLCLINLWPSDTLRLVGSVVVWKSSMLTWWPCNLRTLPGMFCQIGFPTAKLRSPGNRSGSGCFGRCKERRQETSSEGLRFWDSLPHRELRSEVWSFKESLCLCGSVGPMEGSWS